ncbi:MAG: biotin--[acetyl-CoA-carboxylase] ligase [Deltaproteobacteria bacterium]|nr:biotin--[acetyl-CoA-carboxylase] ligase [Deltaproteobacteria bacterium]
MTAFSRELFQARLGDAGGAADRDVRVHDGIDSTSSELARLLKKGTAAGAVVVAERQHAGRGRRGRSWFSPAAGNLYISLAVDCGRRPEAVTKLPLAAGVAAVDATIDRCEPAPVLKWPNDLLLNDRKVGGILCEVTDPRGRPGLVIVGLGLNLGEFDPPPELDGVAAGLAILDREAVAGAWITGVESWAERLRDPGQTAGLVQAWRERAEPFGRRVSVGEVTGVTLDLDSEGRLMIERDDGLVVAVVGGIVENVAATTPV